MSIKVDTKSSIKRIDSITDATLYVDNCYTDNIEKDKQIGLSMSNISWVSQIEDDLSDSIMDSPLKNSLKDSIPEEKEKEKEITIDDILKIDIKNIDDMKLLKYQCDISQQLKKYIKKNNNFDNIIENLNWLLDVSRYLSNKLKLNIDMINNNNKSITRSSYKFCSYNYKCEFNYDHKKKGCFAKHFVHNMVCSDIIILKNYLEKSDNKDLTEITKCVNTLYYVFNHMYEELKKIKTNRGDINIYHKERTPSKQLSLKPRQYRRYKT